MLSTGELFNSSDASKVENTDKDKIKFERTNKDTWNKVIDK